MKCVNCNQPISEIFNYCPYCGALLQEQKGLPLEDINLAFIRADLSGFTGLSEKMESEDVMNLLNGIFGEFQKIINSYQGIIYQVIGDEIVAVFGLKRGVTFSFHMAILAAEDIFKKLNEFNKTGKFERPIGLKVGAEADTASVYKTHGELQTALIITDGFKKSLILQKNAEDNTLLVGENLYQATKSFFEFIPYGELVEDSLSIKAYKFLLR